MLGAPLENPCGALRPADDTSGLAWMRRSPGVVRMRFIIARGSPRGLRHALRGSGAQKRNFTFSEPCVSRNPRLPCCRVTLADTLRRSLRLPSTPAFSSTTFLLP